MEAHQNKYCICLLLVCLLLHTTGVRPDGPYHQSKRALQQTVGSPSASGKRAAQTPAASARKERPSGSSISSPFLRVHNVESATSQETQQLYNQATSVSSIAYLLFGAAEPLAEAQGSSRALLPYLVPLVIRAYASQPERCSSALMEHLYGLSRSLYGTPALQSCHYDLFKALRSTFTWLRNHTALRLQDVPGQPDATAAWPDLSAPSADHQLAQAVQAALLGAAEGTPGTDLHTAAVTASGRCGLGISQFSALVPNISRALQQLHADISHLQHLEKEWLHGFPVSSIAAVAVASTSGSGSARRSPPARQLPEASRDALSQIVQGDSGVTNGVRGVTTSRRRRRRGLKTGAASRTFYAMPPSDFVAQPPAALPQTHIGLLFHVMLYRDGTAGNATGPPSYDQALQYAQRMVRVVNYMSAPTNIQFFVKEVRNNASEYPYLLLRDRKTWLQIANVDCPAFRTDCFLTTDFVARTVSDFPRSINVYVANDMTGRKGNLGFAFVPGSDTLPTQGFIFLSWDQLLVDGGANSPVLYNDGPNTLLHELFHHLGVMHPFDKPLQGPANVACVDGDQVVDTPTSRGPIRDSSFFARATEYCLELFWGRYGGDWPATYERWNRTLGIPDLDKNAWADSCTRAPGYDELGNYMTYNTPVCFAALGHFTRDQALRAHTVTSELNPIMYVWGQYLAAQTAEAPPQASSPPEVLNASCKVTAMSACACKATWQYKGRSYSYCNRTDTDDVVLRCEVADPSSCRDCLQLPTPGQQCILPCSGDPRVCRLSPPPALAPPQTVKRPPPPPLRSPPSPAPWPPPLTADAVPKECTVSVRNCTCRSHWMYNSRVGTYCSPYSNGNLMCLVTPDCPSFEDFPLQSCNSSLSAAYCSLLPTASDKGTVRQPPPMPMPPRAVAKRLLSAGVTRNQQQGPLSPMPLPVRPFVDSSPHLLRASISDAISATVSAAISEAVSTSTSAA